MVGLIKTSTMDFKNIKLPKYKEKKQKTKECQISKQHKNCKRVRIIDNGERKEEEEEVVPKNI